MGLGGIEIGERWRDFRVLFLWLEFDPSIVDRAVKERKRREREREREREKYNKRNFFNINFF